VMSMWADSRLAMAWFNRLPVVGSRAHSRVRNPSPRGALANYKLLRGWNFIQLERFVVPGVRSTRH
jgi:hypothetical protein